MNSTRRSAASSSIRCGRTKSDAVLQRPAHRPHHRLKPMSQQVRTQPTTELNVPIAVNLPDPASCSALDDRRHVVRVLVVSLGVSLCAAGNQVMHGRHVRVRRREALHDAIPAIRIYTPPGRGLSSAGPIPHQSFIRSGNCAPDTPGTRPTAGSWARAKSTRYGNYRLRAAECLGARTRHSMPRRRAIPRNTSSSHQSRSRWEGKHLCSSSTLRRAMSADSGK